MFSPTLAREEVDGEVELILLMLLQVLENCRLVTGPLERSALTVGVTPLITVLRIAADPRQEDVAGSLRTPDLRQGLELSLRIQQWH